jgi:hypothetical protein
MASFTYAGFYSGEVSGTTFTISAAYQGSSGTLNDGQSGDTTFSVGETVSGETVYGYTAAGEPITLSNGYWFLSVPSGGNSTRTTGSTVSFSADTFTTCFLRGTLILTSRGEVPVEKLRAGDLVATKFGGLRPIRWIGTQRFHPRFAGPTNTPIRFAPGSPGQGIPSTTLFVSPGHKPVRQATCLPIVIAEHPWIEGIRRSLPSPTARVAA